MQIDMHYYGVYVLARLAGLRPDAAQGIAMASQYVDDAVCGEVKHHENGNMLVPIVTAHRAVEILENRNVEDQPYVWVPFHFFPGNERTEFTERMICRKDGSLMSEVIDHYLQLGSCPFVLELMGVTAHVYADTFSHYGFSGLSSRRNRVDGATIILKNASPPTATYLDRKMDDFFRKFSYQGGLWTNIRRAIMSDGAEVASGALGHGAVVTLPDLPYLEWSFTYEEPFSDEGFSDHSNPRDFLDACGKIHRLIRRFVSATDGGYDYGTSGVDFEKVKERIRDILLVQDGKVERSEQWRRSFTSGELGIPSPEEIPPYDPETWNKPVRNFAAFDQPNLIVNQGWYRFYQAASLHGHYVLRELLPRHGLVLV